MAETDSEPKTKADVYHERNLLVLAFLAAWAERCHFNLTTAEMGWWPDEDDVNGEEWAVVWVNLPYGQVGWHVPKEMVPDWLECRDPDYDGYTTEEKNGRVERYVTAGTSGRA